jgi:hypothetical protein
MPKRGAALGHFASLAVIPPERNRTAWKLPLVHELTPKITTAYVGQRTLLSYSHRTYLISVSPQELLVRQHLVLGSLLPLALTGCALTATAPPTPVAGPALQGLVRGGQQPVTGAHVYLLAANTTGYNVGSAANASVSLLNSSVLTNEPSNSGVDSSGDYYVTTDAYGNFNISSDYTCTPDANGVPGQQVYLYINGGNSGSGSGTNAAIGLMAVLGDCPSSGNFATATPYVVVNEVTTVAAAYAMAGFAYDATHVSSSGSSLAKVGVKNAFANASNLAAIATGNALATTPAGNGTVPQATIYTLANIIAACVNSNGTVTGPTNASNCYTLFYNAESSGSSGTVPSDTATAAINIAHNPGSNIANLYNLSSTTPPFGSALTSQPNDFTLGVVIVGGGLNYPYGIAISDTGQVWVANNDANSISSFSSTGSALSPASGYTGGGLKYPCSIAIDGYGNIWATGPSANTLSEFSGSGTAITTSAGYQGGGLNYPVAIAVDAANNIWVINEDAGSTSDKVGSLSKFSGAGEPISPTNGYFRNELSGPSSIAVDGTGNVWVLGNGSSTLYKIDNAASGETPINGGGLDSPDTLAIDASGNIWASNLSGSSLSAFSNTGSPLSSGFTGGGITYSFGTAIDGAGNVWVANATDTISEISNSGEALSPVTGYMGAGLNQPFTLAVDGSGDVWIANGYGNSVTELIGIATPVITPIAAGLPSTPTTDGSSNLGTRP